MKERVRLVGTVVGIGLSLLIAGCKTTDGDSAKKDKDKDAAAGSNVDVGFLLTMSYNEAKVISPKNLDFPPFYKIAADEITVLSKDDLGAPKKVRAKGHVFLQIEFREEIRALGQEALLDKDEIILRGKPLLKRGRSVVEGEDDTTVFYIRGTKLQVIGKHRLTNEGGVTPTWKNNWKEGPNPLLPALSPEDVPKEMRSTPLLPPPGDEDKKKTGR